ncbi:hypothetical protein Rhal01_00049 [Rubritalea halochordaticola]|uniref:Spermatogenesis-associated protein 20-like TRX domain-containing protein n=1 Tax=Rubritalea halochordaticola TaxID=714537 RepID=A0ABP9UZV4_9BACT
MIRWLIIALNLSVAGLFADELAGNTGAMQEGEKKLNRLAGEASPYLRQHATNPVDWYPWGEAAFQKAQRENKPILLSIGYSTCHWCHVMERESFENEEIAKLLNAHFVAIKLDREERPDVDKIYMTAYQAMMGENGGWPLNIFLTPGLKPFYGGTYFPPTSRAGRVGFQEVLIQLKDAWAAKQQEIEGSADKIRQHLSEAYGKAHPSDGVPPVDILMMAGVKLLQHGDKRQGGWGAGPKFPQPSHLLFLLREWRRSGNPDILEFAKLTADRMAAGGIHDQLGGGFHRYAVDGKWLVPHFEKMLYDQAQLMDFYTEMWVITKDPTYAQVVKGIAEFVIGEMQAEQGGFYCAEDAQSEGKEGKYWCWTMAELRELLSEDELNVVTSYYGLTDEGNFYDHSDPEALENQNVLSVVNPDVAKKSPDLLQQAQVKMLAVRQKRVEPSTDDKVLASWNGMMIGALARAGAAFHEESYIKASERAYDFVKKEMWNGKRLAHRWHGGDLDESAQAESYLLMLQAARRMYEIRLNPDDLEWAIQLAEVAESLFYDREHGGFFESAEAADVIVRMKGDYDGAMPTAGSVAALEYLKLAEITGREDFQQLGQKTLQAQGRVLEEAPTSLTFMLAALDFYHSKHQRLVLVDGEGGKEAFLQQVSGKYLPNLTVMSNEGKVAEFERGLRAKEGKATAYFCEGEACQPPVTEAAALKLK